MVLLEEVALEYGREPGVEWGTMFRGPGLRINGRIFAFLGRDDRLIVKLPYSRAREAIGSGQARVVTLGRRTLKEWVAFPYNDDDPVGTSTTWRRVAREAFKYVRGLASGDG
jgi:hypothetical protein